MCRTCRGGKWRLTGCAVGRLSAGQQYAGIGSLETLRRIRSFAPRLPVLMLTVRNAEDDKAQALDFGAVD